MLKSNGQKTGVLDQLKLLFQERLGDSSHEAILFADEFLSRLTYEDIASRSSNDWYGAIVSLWQFVKQEVCQSDKPAFFIENPSFEEDGWQTSHTVIGVVTPNRPFLVDSVRMAFNHFGLATHLIAHFPFEMEFEGEKLTSFMPIRQDENHKGTFAVAFFEVDRLADEDALVELKEYLGDVIEEVMLVTSDWQGITQQASELWNELKTESKRQQEGDFLAWLIDHHCTFLACLDLVPEDSQTLKPVVESGLGLWSASQMTQKSSYDFLCHHKNESLSVSSSDLFITKSSVKARVHRPAYMDYISFKRYDKTGKYIGERRFLGLYTSSAYNSSPRDIPILKNKVLSVAERSGLPAGGHAAKELMNILESFPRDELFQVTEEQLYETAMGILAIQERRKVKCFLRKDPLNRYITCLTYVPRERYDTALRIEFQKILQNSFQADEVQFDTVLSESILARAMFTVHVNPEKKYAIDEESINKQFIQATHTWVGNLQHALVEFFGEAKGLKVFSEYCEAFPVSYQQDYQPRTAVYDIKHIIELGSADEIGMSLYRPLEARNNEFRFKLFRRGEFVPLSSVMPILENMGLEVKSEYPYHLRSSMQDVWIHDFKVSAKGDMVEDLEHMKDRFKETFAKTWLNQAENDAFNSLVLYAGLTWREAALLRAYAKYMHQIRFGLSQIYIEETLGKHPQAVRNLVAYFDARFNPKLSEETRIEKSDVLRESCISYLESVSNRDEDRILRRIQELMIATIRTNFYQDVEAPKSYISLKINPHLVPDMPLPRPMFEVFVYAPYMEGVHLRGGKVARGGLRWSDRREDYRTEVLGLVKAQQVKNSVIVPVGAKGGFVCKKLPEHGSRDEVMEEVVRCYQTLIRGLLDITDNYQQGLVISPENVVRHDEDDPYLVVAADKGTATFSDIANALSKDYGFWLGDAFASGGSVGYDHKKMGITAKGVWESVKRSFREVGHDVQKNPFTVLGIGDMSGDVFGNGMLLSDQIKLIGAFNHMHIFVDPEPNLQASFEERKRLFHLSRSSWEDYNSKLISKGGGIFKRSSKTMPVSPEMQKLFDINVKEIDPTDFIKHMLKAKVDLLWNGGIGTYVKAKSENHNDVGDRANDSLRVNGEDLRVRVVGEGGNLGFTQLGRVEASKKGVQVITDFIDNSAGVDCSDHEVNIKILLNECVAAGDMTEKQRNTLLAQMTDDVAALVLVNNYRQTEALSIAKERGVVRLGHHIRLIQSLEREGLLDRELEGLPSDKELKRRMTQKTGLTKPELAVMLAYTKNTLQAHLLKSEIPDDPFYLTALQEPFPKIIVERFAEKLKQHQLRREIISMCVVNDMINKMGPSFVIRLKGETGAKTTDIVRAYTVSSMLFDMDSIWRDIEALDNIVPSETQYAMMYECMRLIRRSSRWFLRQFRKGFSITETVARLREPVSLLKKEIAGVLTSYGQKRLEKVTHRFVSEGVPEKLAHTVASLRLLFSALDIIVVSEKLGGSLTEVASTFNKVGEELAIHWLHEKMGTHQVNNHWESLAISALRDDIDMQQSLLAEAILESNSDETLSLDQRVEKWRDACEPYLQQWRDIIKAAKEGESVDFPLFSVAVRELTDLVDVALPDSMGKVLRVIQGQVEVTPAKNKKKERKAG